MRDLLIAGNWKMNGNSILASELVDEIIKGLDASSSCDLLLCPPFPYLNLVFQGIMNSPISLGAQNLSQHASGAYTGEVSAEMLKDIGCEYVIVGHSERRVLMGETNKIITLFGLYDSLFNQRGKADWAYSSKTKPCCMSKYLGKYDFNL